MIKAANRASVLLRASWILMIVVIAFQSSINLLAQGRLFCSGGNAIVQLQAIKELLYTGPISPIILARQEDVKILSTLTQYVASFFVYAVAAPSLMLSPIQALLIVGFPSAFTDKIQSRNSVKLHTLGLICFFFMESHRYMIGRAEKKVFSASVWESFAGVLSTWLLPILVSTILERHGIKNRNGTLSNPSCQDLLLRFQRPALEAAFQEDFCNSQVQVDQFCAMALGTLEIFWLVQRGKVGDCWLAGLVCVGCNIVVLYAAHYHRIPYSNCRLLLVGFSPILQKLALVVGCGFQVAPGKLSLLIEATNFAGAVLFPVGHKVLLTHQVVISTFGFVMLAGEVEPTCVAGWPDLKNCVALVQLLQLGVWMCFPLSITLYYERRARARFLHRVRGSELDRPQPEAGSSTTRGG